VADTISYIAKFRIKNINRLDDTNLLMRAIVEQMADSDEAPNRYSLIQLKAFAKSNGVKLEIEPTNEKIEAILAKI
jgi:hypothetical protein